MRCGSLVYHRGTYALMEIRSLPALPNAQTHSPDKKPTGEEKYEI